MNLSDLLSPLRQSTETIIVSPEILGEDKPLVLSAGAPLPITGLCLDTRLMQPGNIFFAIFGTYADGHEYIGAALDKGAAAIIAERETEACTRCREQGIPYFVVRDIRRTLGLLSAEFFQHPSREVHSVAVTGTNGKTSVAWLLASAYRELNGRAGLIGTLGSALLEKGKAASFEALATTTPNAVELQAFIAAAKDQGIGFAAAEATSQGLAQCRTIGANWDGALFTNLTRDHLDLHGTLERYKESKWLLFSRELKESAKEDKVAVLNIDDPVGAEFVARLERDAQPNLRVKTYSMKDRSASCSLVSTTPSLEGTVMTVAAEGETFELRTRLVGAYNVSNILAVTAYLVARDIAVEQIQEALAAVTTVPGRLQRVAPSPVHVFVDYAHTPDALVNVQDSLRPLCTRRLITVFGCGGDRDRGKRPEMGKAVAQRSDYAVVTSDNPRTEDPEAIIADILPGLEQSGSSCEWKAITDRREAIHTAIAMAEPGDVILVAGKGHEPYQEIHGVRHPFDDREVCEAAMRECSLIEP